MESAELCGIVKQFIQGNCTANLYHRGSELVYNMTFDAVLDAYTKACRDVFPSLKMNGMTDLRRDVHDSAKSIVEKEKHGHIIHLLNEEWRRTSYPK